MIDQLHAFRTSDCTTAPFRSPFGTPACKSSLRGIDNGYLKGGAAISQADKTYSRIRVFMLSHDFPSSNPDPAIANPAIDFRLVAWDYETRQPRAFTDNLAGELNAVPEFDEDWGHDFEYLFLEPITLRGGEWVILGTATYGDYAVRNCGLASMGCQRAAMQRPPQIGFRTFPEVEATAEIRHPTGGYQGGEPRQIGADPSGNFPWVELL